MFKLNYPFGIYQFFASFLQTKRKCSKLNDFLRVRILWGDADQISRPDVKRDFHMFEWPLALPPWFC